MPTSHLFVLGDVIEVQIPPAPTNPSHPNGLYPLLAPYFCTDTFIRWYHTLAETKHRGFAFVTYASPADAQDAIDNMDLNELNGRVLRVNLARPLKGPTQAAGNRASPCPRFPMIFPTTLTRTQSGSLRSGFASMRNLSHKVVVCASQSGYTSTILTSALGAALRGHGSEGSEEPADGEGGGDDNTMEE